MISTFLELCESLKNKIIRICNEKMNTVIQKYSFLHISKINEIDQNQEIYQKIQESKVITINYISQSNETANDICFLICFKDMVIILTEIYQWFFQSIFMVNPKLEICFLKDTKNIFNHYIKIVYNETFSDLHLIEEMNNFNQRLNLIGQKLTSINKLWKIITPCISMQLIKESYLKLNSDRILSFCTNHNSISSKIIDENEYIELRRIGFGYSCETKLIYLIEENKLFTLKKILLIDDEGQKLLKRETENYSKINHPFLPKFFGMTKNDRFLIIEYINGQTLLNIKKIQLNEKEKITIIFQLLTVIQYLHEQRFIYRDLKPNNIIINESKTITLIDFDRMIKYNDENELTKSFSSKFVAPEIENGNIQESCDIYSFGQMLYYIMQEKDPNEEISNNINDLERYPEIQKMYMKCIYKNPKERPNISELIDFFSTYILNKNIILEHIEPKYQYKIGLMFEKIDINTAINYFTLASNQNDKNSQWMLGTIYFHKRDINKAEHYLKLASQHNHPNAQYYLGLIYCARNNIEKAIHYFTLASGQNFVDAQHFLGYIYYHGQYVQQDINKAILYYNLAAKQNDSSAQCNLGLIYSNGLYVEKDINKAIYYYKLAANQNNSDAQYNLGVIYSNGLYVEKDINKAIYYYKLVSNKNASIAQLNLGTIFYIKGDINKAIYYYTLSANQNCKEAQSNLATIYHKGIYVQRDINKAIYYYSLLANQNDVDSQYILGIIYYTGDYIERDIKKAIFYLTLASNQNDIDAQYTLGFIYYENLYIPRNINKSVYYLTMASNQGDSKAQNALGFIYYKGQYVPRDIKRAIYYFVLASNQNNLDSHFFLGLIYFEAQYINRDIDKSIYYFTLASNQNDPESHFYLGLIYFTGKYVPQNINKAIHYFSLASNLNEGLSQLFLGFIYLQRQDFNKGLHYLSLASNENCPPAQYFLGLYYYCDSQFTKAIYWLLKSSNNNYIEAHFAVGYFYHEGKYIKMDIKKAIHFYKEASSFNDQYAKNNLGILYKNGFYDEIPKNLKAAKTYFKEAIKKRNDMLSMYNLAHIYIYDKKTNKSIKKSIHLLIKSTEQNFYPATILLCLLLIKDCEYDIKNIKNKFGNYIEKSSDLLYLIINIIQQKQLNIQSIYEKIFQQYKNFDFIYNPMKDVQYSKDLLINKTNSRLNITNEFYDGFELE